MIFTLTSGGDIRAAGVWGTRTVTLAAVGLVPGQIRHIHTNSCCVKDFMGLWGGRVVAVHGALALALKGAVNLETGADLHHRPCSGPDGAGVLTWRRRRKFHLQSIEIILMNGRLGIAVNAWTVSESPCKLLL